MEPNADVRAPSHFCALMAMRLTEEGEIQCLVIDYSKAGGRIQVKFAGGNSKNGEVPFKDMVKTLRREVREELGVGIRLADEVLSGRCVFKREITPTHTRFFYLVSEDEVEGILRKMERDDGDEVLSPPFWVEASILCGRIFPSHKPAFLAGLNQVCKVHAGAMSRYRWMLARE